MTLVAIDVAGGAVGAVGLGPVDDDLNAAEGILEVPDVNPDSGADSWWRSWAVGEIAKLKAAATANPQRTL
jgi:hypothetical protein